MKKQVKTKLRLNSQTIRGLLASGLQHVQGGRWTVGADCDTVIGCATAVACPGGRACG